MLLGKEKGGCGGLLSSRLQFSVSLVVTVISGKDLNHALFVPLGCRDVRSLKVRPIASGDKNVPFCIAVVDWLLN